MSIFVAVPRFRSAGPAASASARRLPGDRLRYHRIQTHISGLAARLLVWIDRADAFEATRSSARYSDAMIAAARSTFANVDILVGRTGIRYIPRSVAKM
jgi:hypothetical protein